MSGPQKLTKLETNLKFLEELKKTYSIFWINVKEIFRNSFKINAKIMQDQKNARLNSHHISEKLTK